MFQEAFVTSEEFGQDLEHVEVLQKKFDEFQKDLQNHEDKVGTLHDLHFGKMGLNACV
ncbi:hypothetical protein DPMN_193546 [Dreissena polymorpha]|uniref:Uncharacterized protein n=1 Tax=Dreissena polymorpha TaxID=45954 RepID=A0A9D4BCZ4_DREPO|nr:hypothetical protein DPMN_193546 [Dreissena polymorpha]